MKICLFFSIACLLLVGCNDNTDPATKVHTLSFGHLANDQHSWHKAAEKFKQICEERSNGRLKVKLFPNEQLGNEIDVVTQIQSGTVEMTVTGESMQRWVDSAAFCAIPYLIRDNEHLKKVAEGEIGKGIEKDLIEKTGLRPIAYFVRSPRNLTSNRPIKHPDDLKGMILRVPNDPMSPAVWSALGAKPTPMAFSEVFTGLQQGTVEGQENPYALIHSAAFYEVQKFLNLTEHTISWIYVVIGDKKFQSLPDDLQKIVLDAGQEIQTYERELFIKERDRLAKVLQEKGMSFVEVDKPAFREIAQKAVEKTLKPELLETYKKIQTIE